MFNIKPQQWFVLLSLAIFGIVIWVFLALPRYQIIDLSVNRKQAIDIAQNYLSQKIGTSPEKYQLATIFAMDTAGDRYLQKTLGVGASKEFIKKFSYDLFYWKVRFFKEKQKEEFKIVVSSKTGEVISFSHSIEDTVARPFIEAEQARQVAIEFLKHNYAFSPQQYTLHSQNIEKRENRVDYSFSWETNNVEIPWDNRHGGGKAKLLMTVSVSGKDILYFNKSQLSIPEGFTRYVDNLKQTGENLTLIFRLLYMGLLTIAIMLLVNRKKYVIPQIVKPFYISVGVVLFISIIFDVFNGYQDIIFDYPTTQLFVDYVLKNFVGLCIGVFFTVLVFTLPGLSGETLRYEVHPQKKSGGFLHAILSSFFSPAIARQIWIGYLIAPIILAVQAVVFLGGYKYFGVWDELSWLVQSCTAVVPALSAFVIGFQASITEEIMFRLFAINLFQRYGLSSILAVLLSALIWGFGHTGYAVFPMWFRGLEVTCLGIVFGFVYLRFGLVTVIVTHFLIDAFHTSLQYLIKPTLSFDFLTCLFVIFLPFMFSWIAFILNRSTLERPWSVSFNPQQEFNYQLLKQICSTKTVEERIAFKKELVHHGWDPAIIERVFQGEQIKGN